MAAPQPFPTLASASNSRAASPAPSANGRNSVRDTKQRSPPNPARSKKSRQNKTNGQQDGSSSNNNNNSGSDPQMLHDKHKVLSTATATQPSATAASSSSDAGATANNSPPAASRKKSTKRRARKQKNPATAEPEAAAAVADSPNGDATTPKRQSARGGGRRHTAHPTTDAQDNGSGGGSRKRGSGQRNRGKTQNAAKQQQQRDAPAVSETAASSRASSSLSQVTAAPQSASPAPRSPPQYIKSSSSSSLSMAMIVQGENGRARVYFGPQPSDDDDQHSVHPGFHAGAPRFLPSSVQQRRSSMGHFGPPRTRFPAASYGDGPIPLGLSSPMSPAPQPAASAYYPQATSHLHANTRSVTSPAPAFYAYQPPAHPAYNAAPPPSFRQRSMTSTQLRSSARSFSPQMHSVGYQHQSQQQPPIQAQGQSQNRYQNHNQPIPMRRLSSATSVGLDHAGAYHPPLSAPIVGISVGTRGRSQSVLTHSSAAGLRISMSQAQPGNVLAPYLPSLSRTSSSGAATGTTFASGGYFASRRASVSNTGLAVDPNNTIRIPAIMFQKSNAAEQTTAPPAGARASASPSSSSSADALVTPMSAVDEKVAVAAEAGAKDRVSSETLAMRRLQDMIESMRKLSSAKPVAPRDSAVPTQPMSASEPGPVVSASKSTADVDPLSDAAATTPPASSAAEPSVAAPSSSAAHPTSRFDSILEEDEDEEDDEAKLDADSAANMPGGVSSVSGSPVLAVRDVPAARQSTAAAASAVCAL